MFRRHLGAVPRIPRKSQIHDHVDTFSSVGDFHDDHWHDGDGEQMTLEHACARPHSKQIPVFNVHSICRTEIPTAPGSLIVQAASTESDVQERTQAHGLVLSDKLLREMMRDRAVPTSGADGDEAEGGGATGMISASIDFGTEHHGVCRAADGVPRGEEGADGFDWRISTTSDSTLPPPYES